MDFDPLGASAYSQANGTDLRRLHTGLGQDKMRWSLAIFER